MSRGMSDDQLLTALHLREHDGLTTTQIAQRFRVSRGTIIGALNRITKELAATDAGGNQNGTMQPKWWKR
jgi:transposase